MCGFSHPPHLIVFLYNTIFSIRSTGVIKPAGEWDKGCIQSNHKLFSRGPQVKLLKAPFNYTYCVSKHHNQHAVGHSSLPGYIHNTPPPYTRPSRVKQRMTIEQRIKDTVNNSKAKSPLYRYNYTQEFYNYS